MRPRGRGARDGAAGTSLPGLPTLGAFFGLFLGIARCVWAAVASGLASLPRGGNGMGLIGIGCPGGIGFTMAPFVANLGVGASVALDQATIGALGASVVSAVVGCALLARAYADAEPKTAAARSPRGRGATRSG